MFHHADVVCLCLGCIVWHEVPMYLLGFGMGTMLAKLSYVWYYILYLNET